MPHATPERSSRRPSARPLAFGCLGLFGVLLVGVLGYLAWANQLPPLAPDTRVMPNPNGYDACLAALTKVGQATAFQPIEDPVTADRKSVQQAVVAYRPALDALRAAMRLPYETPPVQQVNRPTPELFNFRQASRAFVVEARLARDEGRPGEALQRSLDAVDLGARVGRGGPLLNTLVGIACTAIGFRSTEGLVEQLSAAEAHAAGARVDRIIATLPTPESVGLTEHRYSLMSTREVFSGQSPIMSSPAATGGTPSRWDRLREQALLLFYPKRWGYQQVDRHYRELAAELRKPYAARKEPTTPIPDDPVLGGVELTLAPFSFQFARQEIHLRVLRTQLALQEFRKRQGRYPRQLRELVSRELRELPVDPFDGQPLRYQPKGDAYLLYSVGPDLKDDGGTPITARVADATSKGDFVAGRLFPPRPPATPASSAP